MLTLSILAAVVFAIAVWMLFGPRSAKWPLWPRLPRLPKKQPIKKPARRRLFILLLLCGLYLPSSVNGSASKPLYAIAFAVSAGLVVLLAWQVGFNEWRLYSLCIPILIWIPLCTLVSTYFLPHFNAAPLALFGLLTAIYSLELRKLRCGDLRPWLAAVSIASIVIGVSMLFYEPVSNFMISHYANFYDELVPNMIERFKPVTVFATHSLAGTFAYLFFFLNFRTYKSSGEKLHLLLALLHVAMCLMIMSATSLAFAAAALVELVYNFRKTALLAGAVAVALLIPDGIRQPLWESVQILGVGDNAVHLPTSNRFLDRYGPDGDVYGTITYIQDHPLMPMGMNWREMGDNGNTTDSGPLYVMAIGSIPMLLLVHGGLVWFLRANLRDKRDFWRMLLVLLASEVGFSTLTYIRSFLLIPAFVIYLNSLNTSRAECHSPDSLSPPQHR